MTYGSKMSLSPLEKIVQIRRVIMQIREVNVLVGESTVPRVNSRLCARMMAITMVRVLMTANIWKGMGLRRILGK